MGGMSRLGCTINKGRYIKGDAMWFLISGKWRAVQLAWPVPLEIEDMKRNYRAHGVPITAIARLKPPPDEWDSDYDDAYDE
jgi:hypothetical protein